jgi:hypothetical protein
MPSRMRRSASPAFPASGTEVGFVLKRNLSLGWLAFCEGKPRMNVAIVGFRSALGTPFRGAKGDNANPQLNFAGA